MENNRGNDIPITSQEILIEQEKEMACEEQLYTIALFDVLGFSNFVEQNGMEKILNLYDKLLKLVYDKESTLEGGYLDTGVVPQHISYDWKENCVVARGNGFINVIHFSDTIILYVNYQMISPLEMLRDRIHEIFPLLVGEIGTECQSVFYNRHYIYSSFLKTCMEFFCEAIILGIPLRGCVSTGVAKLDKFNSIFIGKPLVEAAKAETAQNSIGIAFGNSFKNYHPVYSEYYIPYKKHIKDNFSHSKYLSPMMLDWAKYWRTHQKFKSFNLKSCINQMNTDEKFSDYYNNAINFYEFSEKHDNWISEINVENVQDIFEFYNRTNVWLSSNC